MPAKDSTISVRISLEDHERLREWCEVHGMKIGGAAGRMIEWFTNHPDALRMVVVLDGQSDTATLEMVRDWIQNRIDEQMGPPPTGKRR